MSQQGIVIPSLSERAQEALDLAEHEGISAQEAVRRTDAKYGLHAELGEAVRPDRPRAVKARKK